LTPDAKGSKEFYSALFDWAPNTSDIGGEKFDGWYLDKTNQKMGAPHAGYTKYPDEVGKKQACWLSYITVADVDAAVKLAPELGGKVHKAAADIPGLGRFAVLADDNNAEFAVFTGVDPNEKKKRAKRSSSKGGAKKEKKARGKKAKEQDADDSPAASA